MYFFPICYSNREAAEGLKKHILYDKNNCKVPGIQGIVKISNSLMWKHFIAPLTKVINLKPDLFFLFSFFGDGVLHIEERALGRHETWVLFSSSATALCVLLWATYKVKGFLVSGISSIALLIYFWKYEIFTHLYYACSPTQHPDILLLLLLFVCLFLINLFYGDIG